MKEYRIVLGIEIGSDFLRAAEIEQRENGYFLSRIAEQPLATLEVDELVQKISFLINEEGILSRSVSIAIDTSFTQRDTVELDSDLERSEIIDFLKAEIELHNNFESGQYSPAYEIMNTSSDGYNEIFYAAVENKLLNTLKDFCTRCGLDLQYIDLDHSCSELSVNKLQPRSNNHILVTVKEREIEGSFSKNGRRVAYKYLPYSNEPFYPVTKVAQSLESIANEYVEKIYVTGRTADSFLLDMLRKNVDDRFEMLNPVKNLMLSPLALMNPKLNSVPHNFSAVIGAGLK
jgi:Tfp pilus assembly PilM family ATPase